MESRVSQPGSEDTTARPPSTSVGPEQRHSCSRRSFHSFSLKEIAVTQVGATLGHRELCHPRPQRDSQEPTVADGTSFSSPALGFGEQRDTWKDPPPRYCLCAVIECGRSDGEAANGPGSGMWSLEPDCLGLNPGSTTSLWPPWSCLVALSLRFPICEMVMFIVPAACEDKNEQVCI